MEQPLNHRTFRGLVHYLVQLQVHDSTDDSWKPVEHSTNCPKRIAECQAAAHRQLKACRTRYSHW